ncbi:hypothetical protein OB2597_10084 [Pseudooceanicola batsensis HTCC2597]|uniref:Esterase n=1 Tax=Pseudooceanicola batsensis (strain ATCC BAA-863 / DSM 15984 / KCTC 12145 / HTCC2597) TaxID=252305 RepID=A3TVD9_PSEBH|nr:alpha/beta hydrolase [Pseudooceanicola batsensis]EAQ04485.1 hypothetical protein OB2597_10084 [Pseudooceanicola batsensis HTCC2597]
MIPVLYIHGAGAAPEDPPLADLRRRLGAQYHVLAPELGPPDPATWTARLKPRLGGIDRCTILIGHSLGASHLLRCLAELGPAAVPRALVGLAAPFWGAPEWSVEGFELPRYAPDALAHLPIRLFHACDDQTVPVGHLGMWQEALPAARTYRLDGGGHTFRDNLAPVVMAIAEL